MPNIELPETTCAFLPGTVSAVSALWLTAGTTASTAAFFVAFLEAVASPIEEVEAA